jgi:thioredoxin reductase
MSIDHQPDHDPYHPTHPHTDHDVIVIGGGAAGLAAATTLARARRDVLVLDTGEPRNAPAHGVHSFLSRDGVSPRELLAIARDELLRYGGGFRLVGATSAREVEGGFEVVLADGDTVTARRLIVTTGLVDDLPEIPGLREHWGTNVVHCPYCHGWEVREQALVVIATSPMAAHQALLFSQWSGDVTLLLNGQDAPTGQDAARLSAIGVSVVAGAVEEVRSSEGRITGVLVRTDAGLATVPCQAVVIGPRFEARSAVLESLGVSTVDFMMGEVAVGTHVPSQPMTGQTSVKGVYVAGNVTEPQAQVIHAAGAGVRTAAWVNAELITEDADRAVAQLAAR